MEHNQFKLKLIGYAMITPSIMQLTFMRVDKLPLIFIPGQFITFLLPHDGKIVRRSYSLANGPEHCHALDIAVAPVQDGLATKILFNLKIGDEFLCVGPQGRLILKEEETPSHCVLVATSTGVAPYRSMLSTIAKRLEKDKHLHVTLCLGASHASDLLYAQDFINFSQKHERFNFRAYLSKENILSEYYHYSGYVQSAFDVLPLNPITDLVYLCGNPYMIDESIEKLQAIGFSAQNIRQEKYFSPKANALDNHSIETTHTSLS